MIAGRDRRAAAAALAESEARFATAFRNCPDIITITRLADSVFVDVNAGFCRASGFTRAEVVGRPAVDLVYVHPADRGTMLAAIAAGNGRAVGVDARSRRKDGTVFDVAFSGEIVTLGGVECVLAVVRDVTETKCRERLLRESEAKFAKAFQAGPDGICLTRRVDSTFVDVNQRFCQLTGYARDELIGQKATELVYVDPPGDNHRAAVLAAHAAGPPVRGLETRTRRKDGSQFDTSLSLGFIDISGEPCLLTFLRDITEQKRQQAAVAEANAELIRLNADLEARVGRRTRQLAAEKERAESADRLKSAFLATMSHELRTPLNSIIGFTGILLQGLVGPLSAEQQKQLGMVQTSARHLLSLISDVLDLSKIEAGQLELDAKPFDPAAAVARVVASLAPAADRRGLTLAAEVPPGGLPEIVGDRRRFEQVLLNLVNNAIKFTPAGRVTVLATAAAGRLSVHVTDTGIGIALADQGGLFQPFRQVDGGLGRSHDGTGLGLAICRRLARMMGGDIVAASAPGAGSTFVFWLPVPTHTDPKGPEWTPPPGRPSS